MFALLTLAEESPDPNEVVAGWTGFVVFIGLILALAVLGWSLNKHLKKAHRAAEEGVFDPPADDAQGAEGAEERRTDTADNGS